MQVRSSFIYVEHNGEKEILNGYHMSETNYFKVMLLYRMMWQIIWTDARGMI
jgi:hypothetical protein